MGRDGSEQVQRHGPVSEQTQEQEQGVVAGEMVRGAEGGSRVVQYNTTFHRAVIRVVADTEEEFYLWCY